MTHVAPDLVQKVLMGHDPPHIMGSGDQVRHYIHGGGVAQAIVTAMGHPQAYNEDFNLSTAESTTVLELAASIWVHIKGYNVPFRVIHAPGPVTPQGVTGCERPYPPPVRVAGTGTLPDPATSHPPGQAGAFPRSGCLS